LQFPTFTNIAGFLFWFCYVFAIRFALLGEDVSKSVFKKSRLFYINETSIQYTVDHEATADEGFMQTYAIAVKAMQAIHGANTYMFTSILQNMFSKYQPGRPHQSTAPIKSCPKNMPHNIKPVRRRQTQIYAKTWFLNSGLRG
jgi:hypothetical protein